MKKFILVIILSLFFSSPSWCEWTFIDENLRGEHIYIDFSTLIKEENNSEHILTVWVVSNYNESPDGPGSLVGEIKINCKEGKFKILSTNRFSKKFGKGDLIKTYQEGKWYPYGTGEVMDTLSVKACNY